MKILHRYLLGQLVRNFLLGLATFSFLFLLFDFFDRIDNILGEDPSVSIVLQYFIFKLPYMLHLMLPLSLMFAVLFTFGILSKNSEITAMRAAGAPLFWIARPLIAFSLAMSVFALALNEFIVPVSERRQKELYNIDIKKKDQRGSYNQNDFWWRDGETFYSGGIFDSRTNTILNFSAFDVSRKWRVTRRVDSVDVKWIDDVLGWTMQRVKVTRFTDGLIQTTRVPELPVAIRSQPKDFYEFRDEPQTMSFLELRDYMAQQSKNGLPTNQYLSDLYQKLSFPLVTVVVPLLMLPFALKSSRSGSLAASSVAAIMIGFTYYIVDSFSIAMGRAELLPPFLAAWMANMIMGGVGIILNLGAESPS